MAKEKILIVEDEAIIALEMKSRLLENGYDVADILESGEEAIEYLRKNSVDLIIMDVHLAGDMDGTEAAKFINKKYEIPIIYLTAYSDEETVKKASKTMVYGYIIKPIREKEFMITMEMAFSRHKLEKKNSYASNKEKSPIETHKKIGIWRGDEIVILDPEDLICVEIQKGVLNFYTTKETFIQRGVLNTWEEKLKDYGFFRCHKSFLVNVNKSEKILYMGENNYFLKLYSHEGIIPIARDKINILKSMMEL